VIAEAQTRVRIRRIYSGRKVRTRRELSAMAVLLLLAAIGADTLGAHGAAFYLLLAAVVVTAHAALQAYGRLVELPGSAPDLGAARLNVTLGLLALVLVLVAAAVHADGAVPPVGISAAVASLALLGLQGAVKLATR
jgi:hypothetical protein